MELLLFFQSTDEMDIQDFETKLINLNIEYNKVTSTSFDGLNEVIIALITSGAAVATIKGLKDIIVNFINRHSTKSFKIGDITITGYNDKTAADLLDKALSIHKLNEVNSNDATVCDTE
jgi:hypothetical protein